jgi:arylsulfatase A-like enzyme
MRAIVIDLDSLRPDHLGCYGYARPTSPNIDAIAASAFRADRYYCANSPCQPSRTALLSGRYGIRNGVVSHGPVSHTLQIDLTQYNGPRAHNEVLPRHLRRHGIDTISISNFADRHSCWYWMCGWSEFLTPNLRCGNETAEEVNAVAIPWLRKNAGRDNYLLHLNYWDIHRPYKMSPTWGERFGGLPVRSWPDEAEIERMSHFTGPFTACQQWGARGGKSKFPLMPDEVTTRAAFEQMINGYDASIAYTDHHLGQVFDELDRQGVIDETAIIITGDHGDAFGEHGIYSDHVCADECIHRVPMIVRWPGVTREKVCDTRLLTNVDFAPTICDLLGVPAPADWDGTSFAPAVRGEPGGPDRDYVVWEHGLYTAQRAVRTREHLMIQTLHALDYNQFEPLALFDMRDDPYQTRNIAADQPEIVAKCEQMLATWMAEQQAKPGYAGDPLQAVVNARLRAESTTRAG